MSSNVNIYEILNLPEVMDTVLLHLTDKDTRSLLVATGFSMKGARSYWYMTPIRYAFPSLTWFLKKAADGYEFLVLWMRHDDFSGGPLNLDLASMTLVAFVIKDEFYVDCSQVALPETVFEDPGTDVSVVEDIALTSYEPICRYVEMWTPTGVVRLKLPLVSGPTDVPVCMNESVLSQTKAFADRYATKYIFTGLREAKFADAPEAAYADRWYTLTFNNAVKYEYPQVCKLP